MSNIDRHIGSKIRLRRKSLNITQYSLAYDLGISFQQLQKYESGRNRVSASMLYEIAKILKTAPDFFFDGLSGIEVYSNLPKDINALKMMDVISKIKNQAVKDKIFDLISELK